MSYAQPERADSGPPDLSIHAGVATITLNRPAHRNRLHHEDLMALLAYCERVRDDPGVHALVLTARTWPGARVFSAGYHISEFAEDGLAPMPFEGVPDTLARLPMVTICALSGSVYGGATDLALACDFRIGVTGMELRMPAAALGLHYYPSGLRRYVARIGLGAARRLFLLAEPIGADDLLAMGYLDQLVAPEALETAVQAMTDRLAQMAPLALRGMKQTLQEMAWGEDRMDDWRLRESQTQISDDFAEGRRAFAERRPPRFHGR